jgi:hypothetical protein
MRLINTETRQLEHFLGDKIPKYAILSHRWSDEEVTFAEYGLSNDHKKAGYKKIDYTCIQARQDNILYAWVDTCCIDKSSSSELSESINSMYRWYQKAEICYVYLVDVDVSSPMGQSEFEKSEWFLRGWTLQELIAPEKLTFYDSKWSNLGNRYQNGAQIDLACGLPQSLWQAKEVANFRDGAVPRNLLQWSVAQRMSWASNRKTTIIEDMAYCLLGLFEVNMPLLYGEGHRAFARLQEEISKHSSDQSIFAWGFHPVIAKQDKKPLDGCRSSATVSSPRAPFSLPNIALAKSPIDFRDCGGIIQRSTPALSYNITSRGIEIELPVIKDFTLKLTTGDTMKICLGLLCCEYLQTFELLGIILQPDLGANPAGRWKIQSHSTQEWFLATIPIDSKQAAQAVPTKITMSLDQRGLIRDRFFPGNYWDTRKVCFTSSATMRAMSYSVSGVAVIQADFNGTMSDWVTSDSWPKGSAESTYLGNHWNGDSATLSTPFEAFSTLYRVRFSSSEPARAPFYIYVWRLWDDHEVRFPFILKKGTFAPFHNDARFQAGRIRNLVPLLQEQLDLLDSRVVVGFKGKPFEVILKMDVRDVLQHKIFTVFIDATPLFTEP